MNKFFKSFSVFLIITGLMHADAIRSDGDMSENIQNLNFSNYHADSGGAVYVYGNLAGNISNSNFTHNNADNYGGAVAVANRLLGTISNSNFTGNSVSGNMFGGGAILATSFFGNIANSVFSGNTAYNGGAVYVENFYGTITDTNFTNNIARGKGGAIYIQGAANMTLHSANYMLFSGNRDSGGSNAIYYNGYGGYENGILNIITDNNSIIEFRDTISDYGKDESGILSVKKDGEGTLIYDASMTYRGDTDINEGTLLIRNVGSVAGTLNIADNAALSINNYSYEYILGSNVNIHGGTLDINLNGNQSQFLFSNKTMQQNFTGTLKLTNAFYNLLKENNYKLILNDNSVSTLSQNDANLKSLVMNGGTINLSYRVYDTNSMPVLSINNFNIEEGGTINFYTDFRSHETNLTNNQNLYDLTNSGYQTLYQVVNATNGVYGDKSKVKINNVSPYNYIVSNIIQNGAKTGEVFTDIIGSLENDGVYAGLGNITQIKSLTNVIFDGGSASNNRLDAILAGNGNFTFSGSHSVFIGNSANNYTGATFLTDYANVTAINNNIFGKTAYLTLENNTIFNLNSYSQTINGKIENNGSIELANNGNLSFKGGYSLGNNSLSGNGTLIISGDFLIDGSNKNLNSNIILNNATAIIKQSDSLGNIGNLTFNGGGLNLESLYISVPFEPLLTVNSINIGGNGGMIAINSNLTQLADNVTAGLSLYEYSELLNAYKIIDSANGVSGTKTQLSIINAAEQTVTDIVQNGSIVGEAMFGNTASVQDDGIYVGFGLREIVSYSNVEFDAFNANNNILNAILSGNGNMTFVGDNSVYVGNAASNYTGSTLLKGGINITAISNNIFGNTTSLTLEKDTTLNLNSYSQTVHGSLSNNGTIDFGDYALFEFNGGSSLGSNSLKGYGNIIVNGDFNIEGENGYLSSHTSINNGTTTISSVNSLGNYGSISLENDTSLLIDAKSDGVFTNSIYGHHDNASLMKKGDGSLKLDNYTDIGLIDIIEGSLIADAYKIYGDINIASDSALIFDNTRYSDFYNQFSGDGGIIQLGNYILTLHENSSDFTGSYDIREGVLKAYSFDSLRNAENITISRSAVYMIESNKNENLINSILGEGALHINLNNANNNFTIADAKMLQDFSGIIELTNAKYDLFKNNSYSLALNSGSFVTANENGSSLKDLIFNGGTLNLNINNISSPLQVMLNVENLNISGSGGKIMIEADLSPLVDNAARNSNLYDYSSPLNAQKIVNAANGVNGVGTQISIDGFGGENISENITQNNDIVGKAVFGTIAAVEHDGIYLGFGLEEIESFKNKTVELNSSTAANFLLNARLIGEGGFSFSGNNSVFVGNAMNSYDGSTLLKNGTSVTAISHNSFGYTNSLSLENGAVFNLGEYYQSAGELNNNAIVNINGGQLTINGAAINNGVINLNDYSYVYFVGSGISAGNNSLIGGGTINFYDDFEIYGANKNLNANIYIGNAVLKMDSAEGLGGSGTIYLNSDQSAININMANDETMDKNIYGQGALVKEGNGSLTLSHVSAAVKTADILGGALIIDANRFYGDINISQNANLLFNNSQSTAFYNKLSGSGNITQLGNSLFAINSDNSAFDGIYMIEGGALAIGSDSSYVNARLGGDIIANDALLYSFGEIGERLSLDNSSWRLNRDSALKSLVLSDNSNVFMNGAANFISLKIDSLKGDSGNFYQRIQLQQLENSVTNNGDLLVINNSSKGNYTIHFDDSNSGALSLPYEENILVVRQDNQDGNYEANFTGAVDVGANRYFLAKSDTNSSFYLKSGSCTSYACASLSFPNINYMINYITTQTLHQRMGEANIKRTERDDVWIKTYFGELNSFENYFEIDKINYYGFALGGDRVYEMDMSDILLGFTVGFNKADTEYKDGNADSRHYNVGIYSVLKYNDGFYVDMLARYQKNKNNFNTKTSNGFSINGDGNSGGILISIEGGKRYEAGKYFIEPQIQSSYFYHDGFVINSSNGLKTQIDDFESLRTRLGALFGYKLRQIDIYLKAGYIREFKGRHNYSFNDGEKQKYDVNWNFIDSALGAILNSGNNHLYFEGAYQSGNAFKNIKLNAGYRYEF
ncbi:MAG: autotransporter outer membrane beta-barrel domain-containing protein [Campylobacteraceae bacterium]|jgi:outer membrane autotransporter protein|nr:autotransporter outer membrane beta-barrel domain-containing protein [Campylobacteraceae bacterium]